MSTPIGDLSISSINKTKRPSSSAFKQQRLPAWQPILTAGTVLPAFFVIGIAFIPVGIGLLSFSNEVQEKVIEYTDCASTSHMNSSTGLPLKCDEVISNDITASCKCSIRFEIKDTFEGEVFLYYGLTNFYQNHRRYVKSRDDLQLLGKQSSLDDCEPFAYVTENNKKIPIAPCGAIANSLFNDTLSLLDANGMVVPLIRTGIAWPSDKEKKFNNPPGDLSSAGAFKNTAKPPNWARPVYELDPENPSNNGYENEDLIVWMRTSALPTFRKLYRRVNHTNVPYKNGLPKGNYTLDITYSYPVTSFEGTKRLIISTTSLLGGKNPFLGVAYIVVGCVCLILGIMFLVIHIKYGKRGTDVSITNRTPYRE